MITDGIEKHKRATGDHVFSIIIPTWNNLPYLQLCIDSIRKNSDYSHQLIIHINEGKDGTKDWVHRDINLDYSYSSENIGICYALNACRPLVTTPYIVYMNDDMYACPGWDKILLEEIKKAGHNNFMFSCTAIEPSDTGNNCVIIHDYGKDIKVFREKELLEQYATHPMHDWQGSTWPPNVVHTDVWDLVGGYSVEFSPGFYSDPDFSMKLWVAGVRLFKGVSNARVYHFGSKSTKRSIKNKGYYTFIKKWGISSSTLTNQFLHRGAPFDGPLKMPSLDKVVGIKNFWKRINSSFRSSD